MIYYEENYINFYFFVSIFSYCQTSWYEDETLVNITRQDSTGVAYTACATEYHYIYNNKDSVHDYEFSRSFATDYYISFKVYNRLTFLGSDLPCSESNFTANSITFYLLDENDNMLNQFKVTDSHNFYQTRLYGIQANTKYKFRVEVDEFEYGIAWYELKIISTDFLNGKDKSALSIIYQSTDGDNWHNSWDLTKPSASWESVSRTSTIPGSTANDFTNGTKDLSVWGINLYNNNLTGRLPELPSDYLLGLIFIDIGSNRIEGSVPNSLFNSTSLRSLNLSNNFFSGKIPDLTDKPLDILLFQSNYFQFGDFEGQFQHYNSNVQNFSYLPQYRTFESRQIIVELGDTVFLDANVSGSSNNYLWYFNDIPILGLTGPLIAINDIDLSKLGRYRCEVSSNLVTGLTIQTGDFILQQDVNKHPDYPALVALYNSTNGANWANNTNWLSNKPLNEWHGVTLDSQNGRVIRLDLFNNNLNGMLPIEIGSLINLQDLLLTSNNLNGEIPIIITDLSSLQKLYLDENNFTGTIPKELERLNDLQILRLGYNNLQGNIPSEIGNLNNLLRIDLQENNLTGFVPPELGGLSNLITIQLFENQLSGNIPSGFGSLNDLRYLYINSNKLSGFIPDLSNTDLNNQFGGGLNISNNDFIFSDIESQFDWLKTNVANFIYSPMNPFNQQQNIPLVIGQSITLNAAFGSVSGKQREAKAAANEYQWYKDAVIIDGATNSSYTIENLTNSDAGTYICKVTNADIVDLVLESNPIVLNAALGLDGSNKSSFKIYPNPASNNISIKINNSARINNVLFYDILGKQVKKVTNNFEDIDLQNLDNGLYFLKIKSNLGEVSKKLIVDN